MKAQRRNIKPLVKPLCQIYSNRQAVKNLHIQQTSSLERIASKMKQIRVNYQKVLDAGRQSRGSKIVATCYELCSEIWSGSPPTESALFQS